MENPYRFSPANHRLVLNASTDNTKRNGLAAAIYAISLIGYSRRYLRVNQNAPQFAAFAILSAPAAFAYSRFVMDSAENEAAVKNNTLEENL